MIKIMKTRKITKNMKIHICIIFSFVAIVNVTVSSAIAKVVVELSLAILDVDIVGGVVSIIIALLLPKEPDAPGDANVKVALFPAALKGLEYNISKKIEWVFSILAIMLLLYTLWSTM